MTKQPSTVVETQQGVDIVQEALRGASGSRLVALYRIDHPTASGINLLAVINDHDDLHQLRQALRPYHQPHQLWPIVTTANALSRHLKLDLQLAQQFSQHGQLLLGQPLPVTPTAVSLPETIGLLASRAIDASSVLAPHLLKPDESELARQRLTNLAAYLGLETGGLSPIETLAATQARLAHMLASHPELQWPVPTPNGAPPLVDALVAIYERQDRAIFMLPDWSPEEIESYINQVDWTAVSTSLSGQYQGLQLTTPSQFRLMLQYDKTADFYFENYIHAWGINAQVSLEMPRWRIYRDLACFASNQEIQQFTQDYFSAGDDQLSMLVHDYQNKLLNIQLREELMHRLTGQERAIPPTPLPGREAPNTEKVSAIFNQFAWWSDHYFDLMTQEIKNAN